MNFQKSEAGFHRILARRDNFLDIDTKPSDGAPRATSWYDFPSLEGFANAGKFMLFILFSLARHNLYQACFSYCQHYCFWIFEIRSATPSVFRISGDASSTATGS
jgi:hypothetical protein